ncbi:MAG: Fe(3+) ABC transporter substrate-binding protein [Thiotrichales bacterium]|nr:Fe(3+) ABC transporter substrate-binding protein [Thiotrichales bacterium]
MLFFIITFFSSSFLTSVIAASDNDLTVYSTRKEHLIKPLFDAFTEKTGIKVSYLTGKGGALIERIKLEGKKTKADLFMTVDAGNLWYASTQNLFQPVESQIIENNIPSHLRDLNGLWTGLSVRARTIIYSTERVNPDELSSYQDLANKKWKGRLCLRTSKKVYTKSLVSSLIYHDGLDKTTKVVRGWIDNLAATPHAEDVHIMTSILAGQCDVGIVNSYYFGRLQAKDPNVALKLFWANQKSTGTHVNVSGAGVTKHSKNSENAIKLLEFLTSIEAQKIYVSLNKEYPASQKIKAANLITLWGDFNQDKMNLSVAGKNQADSVSLMQREGYR